MDDQDALAAMASMEHSAKAGHLALAKVIDVLDGLRPDLAMTVLATAAGAVALLVPASRRQEIVQAHNSLVTSSYLRAEERHRDRQPG
jgi:hypothetical protein